jgi:hypothetical protein
MVLRTLERRLDAESHQSLKKKVGRVAERLSRTRNLEDELERLYAVKGFDRLAIGLMWLASNPLSGVNGQEEEVLDYQAKTLSALLGVSFSGSKPADATLSAPIIPVAQFEESLYRFGRCVSTVRKRVMARGLFQGFTEDIIYHVIDEASLFKQHAIAAGRPEFVRFCSALDTFLEYVIGKNLLNDIRALNVLESVNLTAQTAIVAPVTEDQDALAQAVALLEKPAGLFLQH